MIQRFHYGLIALAKTKNIDLTPITRNWLSIYRKREKSRGRADAVKFMKNLNTIAERYALRQPIVPIPWTKSGNDNYPKIINFAKQNLRSKDFFTVVMTLSVFRSVEELRLPISKDIETITQPCSYDIDLVQDIIDFIPEWLKRFTPIRLPKMKYHLTIKNGPNGHALKTSDMDVMAVMNDSTLFEAIRTVEECLGDKRPMREVFGINENFKHSKLVQFPDKAGKTRTIAVIDYYSQRCLKPLHDGLMDFLSKLVSDGTYSHQNVGKFAQLKTKEKSFIYCSDLTAFTDRFPAIIQEKLLSQLLKHKDPDLWKSMWTLLAKRTFRTAWSDDEVTYNCGQPMGAYGSWPLCTLAHHLIVEYCAKEVDKASIKHQYRIIGDDNIITDRKTAMKYSEVIQSLGIEINAGKTVCSPEQSEYSGAEVAKQLYLNGICLTPITPGFMRLLRKPYMFNTCLGILRGRYEDFCSIHPATLIDSFFRKERVKKLVWLIGTNPINGNIKPTDVGYDINCPWDADKPRDVYLENYRKIIIDTLLDQSQRQVDDLIDDFDDFLDGDLDVLDFSTFDFSKIKEFVKSPKSKQGSLWQDSTRPEPVALSNVVISLQQKMDDIIASLSGVARDEPLDVILDRFSYVQDPNLPYQDRYELKHKRMSSVITKLFDYKDDITFTTIKW